VYNIWREHHDNRNQNDGEDNAAPLKEETSIEQSGSDKEGGTTDNSDSNKKNTQLKNKD
jgi:hypothetical protein